MTIKSPYSMREERGRFIITIGGDVVAETRDRKQAAYLLDLYRTDYPNAVVVLRYLTDNQK